MPSVRPHLRRFLAGLLAAALSGCALPHAWHRDDVSVELTQRSGVQLGEAAPLGQLKMPTGLTLDDALTEESAVVLALWNNALFQEQLTELGIAHGDLIQAGLLPNPEFAFLFAATDKGYRYTLDLPLEAFWLRPIRLRAAADESARVGKRLTQLALDLIRDVRQAYADVLLADARLKIAEEAVSVRSRIAKVAAVRLEEGDISPQEAGTAKVDALLAEQDVARIQGEVKLALERLRNLLAIGCDRAPLRLDAIAPPMWETLEIERLTTEAVASRPDLQAAEQNVSSANERLRLSKLGWIRFLGIADATAGRRTGHELGPAVRFALPIFNHNQGAVARAEAELERAERQKQTLHDQIVLDVHQAHHRYTQARAELEVIEKKVLPEIEENIGRAEKAFREGNTAFVVVLEATRQRFDTRLRQEQLRADLRRAAADLERAVGRRLDRVPTASSLAGSPLPLHSESKPRAMKGHAP